MKFLVKICGVTRPEDAAASAAAGADAIGLNFWRGSKRFVEDSRAREIIAALPPSVLKVGVFVNAHPLVVTETLAELGLDLVQLHGDEPPDFAAALAVPVVKVFKPSPTTRHEDVIAETAAHQAMARPPVAFLVDGYHPMSAGGAGTRADWRLAALVATRTPMLLAGGLTPENVARAIEAVQPLGVDVSSGVEREGVKDPERIAAFVGAAKAAFELQTKRAGSTAAID